MLNAPSFAIKANNVAVTSVTSAYGQPETISATVTPVVAIGTVAFYDGLANYTNRTNALGGSTFTLDGSTGVATLASYASLGVGSHTIYADYESGSGSTVLFGPSLSMPSSLTTLPLVLACGSHIFSRSTALGSDGGTAGVTGAAGCGVVATADAVGVKALPPPPERFSALAFARPLKRGL